MPAMFSASIAVLVLVGVPIFVVLLLPVMIAILTTTSTPPTLVVQRIFAGIDRFPLMAIPFFIYAGNIMASGGISRRMIRIANALVRPLTGGLAVTTVVSSMFFGAISASSPATVIAVGKVMLPALLKEGYGRSFSVGLLMSSGSLANILPPSIFMIVYGAATGTSIGALFLAGIGAGLVFGIMFLIVAYVYGRNSSVETQVRWNVDEITSSLRDGIWGLLAPFIILGGIYGGIFTPTEAAAVAVVYSMVVAMAIYREMDWRALIECTAGSAVTIAQVMIILGSASVFAWFLTTSGAAAGIGAMLADVGSNPLWVFFIVNLIVLVAGMFLDPISIVVIVVPFIVPVALAAGIDPVHLGIVIAVNASIGMFTAPLGLNLFVSTGLGVSYREAALGSLPFLGIALIALAIVTYLPWTALWLPSLYYPGVWSGF